MFVQSLLATHDAIAQKDFYPHLPDIPIEVDEDEETVKIVQLVKSNEPLVCIDVEIDTNLDIADIPKHSVIQSFFLFR